jgi:hypothetical protein
LGNLHVAQAIPALAEALLEDNVEVAEAALSALGHFSDDELRSYGLDESLVERVAARRGAPGA